jgi:hypothetical protein
MDLAAWFGSQGVFSTGEAAHIFGSGSVPLTGLSAFYYLPGRIPEMCLLPLPCKKGDYDLDPG